MSFRRQQVEDEEDDGLLNDAIWLYSYADMITQLLLFTILSVTVVGLGDFNVMDPEISAEDQVAKELEDAAKQFDAIIQKQGLQEMMAVDRSADRLVIRLKSFLLFELGSDELTPAAAGVLDAVVELLNLVKRQIRVEGHTDDIPIKSARFPSNWELSTGRAISVIRYLEEHGIARERISAAGYGEFHPIVSNDNERQRALNRRVEIVLLGEG